MRFDHRTGRQQHWRPVFDPSPPWTARMFCDGGSLNVSWQCTKAVQPPSNGAIHEIVSGRRTAASAAETLKTPFGMHVI
jgi:hypothetical protein